MKSQMASGQMPATERVKISNDLLDILEHHTSADEGEVRHFLLLALGRAWQVDPRRPTEDTPESLVARQRAVDALLKFAGAKELPTRKAAVLATVYLKGHGEAMPVIIAALATKLRDTAEDLDVRMAAATALGPLATPADRDAIDALHEAMRDTDPQHVELVWQSALSLAQLDDATVADTILKLLSRDELAQLQVYDREKDPKNPVFRTLSEAEQERILINTMIGVEGYDVPSVQEKLRHIAATDPSQRVRAALQSNTPRDAASGAR
jgi:HEAT repeat protein